MSYTDFAQPKSRTDFRIYTAALEVDSLDSTIVRMVGSSTERDVQKNFMASSAIEDMCNPALVGMTIFLNHKYDIPHDVYGSLLAVPEAKRQDGFIDVYLTADTDLRNPPAAQVLQQIRDGRKHGCSIGCMVEEWDFAGESDNQFDDSIVIKRVRPVEWSIVGIPANRRSWVENAIQGVFTRSFEEGNYDEAYKLAPTVKSLYSRNYEKMVLSLSNTAERTRFEKVPSRPTPAQQLFWEPSRRIFIIQSATGRATDADRETVAHLLGLVPDTTAADDSDKAAQKARSSKYGIGIKDGGNVTKPSAWASVPDSEWGDPVNYRYPMPDKAHADNAASRWGDASNRSQYTSEEQSIIHGRITRRQAHFGTDDKKEQAMKPELTESHVVVQADGSHEPTTGHHNHPHHDMHDGLHDHHHEHNGDNTHSHAHDVHLPLDTTTRSDYDGDGDNDADRAQTAGAEPQETPAVQTADVISLSINGELSTEEDRATALAHYNTLGRLLGFAPVTASNSGAHGAAVSPEQPTLEAIETRIAQSVKEALETVLPQITSTLPHTALSAAAPENTQALTNAAQKQIETLLSDLTKAKAEHNELLAHYEALRGRGLGRPTTFTERQVPAHLLVGSSVSIEAQTPEQLRAGTTLTRRIDGVLCRKWPVGHGVHQRPELTASQMSIMTNGDVRNYLDGLEVLVPHLSDND